MIENNYIFLLFSGILFFIIVVHSFVLCNAEHELGHDVIGSLKIKDPELKIEQVSTGLKLPTHIAFLAKDDILVLEKNDGTVRRIINGSLLPHPLLDLNVANRGEKGMLGVAISRNSTNTYVFLYLTETSSKDGGKIVGNMLYRYQFRDNNLLNPKLLLHLPANPGPYHYGGAVKIGPDGLVYISIGDTSGSCEEQPNNALCQNTKTQAQNYVEGIDADGRAGILRVTQDGKPSDVNVLGIGNPLDKYYAYGIRNSFSIDFDPQTGILWDTENGPEYGDEINIVKPGFNSGWHLIQGIWNVNASFGKAGIAASDPKSLVNFGGKGHYSPPEFVWNQTVGPTAIKFLDSDKYGKSYKNDLFVADSNYGNIYQFNLNQNRTDLILEGPLEDKVAENNTVTQTKVFAEGFGLITDLEVSPDGYLYVLTYGSGTLFKILP